MSSALPTIPFYFLRHGVTDHNLRRIVMGQLDVPLNDVGRRQAEEAARVIAFLGIAAIVCSPLSRASETARIVAEHLGLPVTSLDDLRERDWGSMAGRPYREMIGDRMPVGAETVEAFTARVLAAALVATACQPVLIVAHSGVCRVLRRHLGLGDGNGPVPNAVPLHFSPRAEGGWSESPVTAAAAARFAPVSE